MHKKMRKQGTPVILARENKNQDGWVVIKTNLLKLGQIEYCKNKQLSRIFYHGK
jgi:hypothetical protein